LELFNDTLCPLTYTK